MKKLLPTISTADDMIHTVVRYSLKREDIGTAPYFPDIRGLPLGSTASSFSPMDSPASLQSGHCRKAFLSAFGFRSYLWPFHPCPQDRKSSSLRMLLRSLLCPFPGFAYRLHYFFSSNLLSQARHIEGGTAGGRFRNNGKHIALAATNHNLFFLGLFKYVGQFLTSLRIRINFHDSFHHLYPKFFCNIAHMVIKTDKR